MKKGFTLVELLAVIVILAVILVIAVPQINSVIKQTKKNSLGSTAKLIAAKAEEATVENEILESNEALTCSNLVKLDDNYGSCTVSVINGVATVTIEGSDKFAGITCTGTKSNMSCTEGPSILGPIYSFTHGESDIAYYDYVVVDSEECERYLLTNVYTSSTLNEWGMTSEEAEEQVETICSNSDDVYDNGSGLDTGAWFTLVVQDGALTYENIKSFVEIRGIKKGYYDYRDVKYPNNRTANVFVKHYFNSSINDVCFIYNDELTCLEATPSAYTTNISKLEELFGEGRCHINTSGNNNETASCGDSNSEWLCQVNDAGLVGCVTGDASCTAAYNVYWQCIGGTGQNG